MRWKVRMDAQWWGERGHRTGPASTQRYTAHACAATQRGCGLAGVGGSWWKAVCETAIRQLTPTLASHSPVACVEHCCWGWGVRRHHKQLPARHDYAPVSPASNQPTQNSRVHCRRVVGAQGCNLLFPVPRLLAVPVIHLQLVLGVVVLVVLASVAMCDQGGMMRH